VGNDAAFEVLSKRLADMGHGTWDMGRGSVVVALAVDLSCADQLMSGLEVFGFGEACAKYLPSGEDLNVCAG
jgi:hypothetical protein